MNPLTFSPIHPLPVVSIFYLLSTLFSTAPKNKKNRCTHTRECTRILIRLSGRRASQAGSLPSASVISAAAYKAIASRSPVSFLTIDAHSNKRTCTNTLTRVRRFSASADGTITDFSARNRSQLSLVNMLSSVIVVRIIIRSGANDHTDTSHMIACLVTEKLFQAFRHIFCPEIIP